MKSIKEIGELLKKTREKKGLSIEKVYKETRIHGEVIKALESGNIDALFNMVYAKAFLRKYLKYLGLDKDSIAQHFAALYPVERVEEAPRLEREDTSTDNVQLYKIGLSIVIVCIFIFFVFSTLLKIKSFMLNMPRKAPVKVEKIKPVKKIEKVEKVERPKRTTKSLFPISERSNIVLSVSSSEKVWMRVKKDGDIVFSGILPENCKESWTGNKNFSLRVGKLEALKFTINDNNIGKLGSGVQDVYLDRKTLTVDNKELNTKIP
ncbi:MAG: helix-turn-helix domain-containing protein [Candidatus Omnitrophica bacterium]|nr:helix-turn-helix domain-containing protein [Candidatus Omnitrophota bacterium]